MEDKSLKSIKVVCIHTEVYKKEWVCKARSMDEAVQMMKDDLEEEPSMFQLNADSWERTDVKWSASEA